MQRTSQDSRNQNSEYGPPAANVARINRYDSPDGVRNPQRGFRANTIRFRSTLAKIDERKSPRALIDSGATHNFFYEKSMFLTYEPIANETVSAAFGTTSILGQGLVWIPLHGGMQVTAYHPPHFHSHIRAVCCLSKHFDVLFSDKFEGSAGCFLLRPGTPTVLFKTPCSEGLYTRGQVLTV